MNLCCTEVYIYSSADSQQAPLALNLNEELSDLSEDDAQKFILTEEEQKLKSLIWHNIN